MKKVQREELLDLQAYDRERERIRPAAMAAKALRRVHVGPHLTFLFENRETVRYQVQEMMRAERLFREAELAHELDTYTELLGGPGELGCSLLIEIADAEERDRKLRRWKGLLSHLYARLPDGRRVPCTFDPRQVGEDRLSSVQYLRFDVGGVAPASIGCDHPDIAAETVIDPTQRAALAEDLAA